MTTYNTCKVLFNSEEIVYALKPGRQALWYPWLHVKDGSSLGALGFAISIKITKKTKIYGIFWSYRKQMAEFAKATTNMFRQVKTTKWVGGKSRIQNKYRPSIPALTAIANLELCHLSLQSDEHIKFTKSWIITSKKSGWLYLVCNVVWEPVQSLIQPLTRGGACALDVPAMNDLDSQLPRWWWIAGKGGHLTVIS
jgi:hypothetical protein